MKPYYQDDLITLYHGDCLNFLDCLKYDCVFADPPYGVNKSEWDKVFFREWTNKVIQDCNVIGITPGIVNILKMPQVINNMEYRWTLVAHLINGMTRGAFGFGNYILCLIYSKDNHSLYSKSSDIKDVVVGIDKKQNHPSPKPIKAMMWIVSLICGDVILDPFAGSGTTLVAAKNLNRKAIGIEIEEKYCEIAANRLRQEVLDLQ